MTQFDLSANPMLFAFTDTPDLSAFNYIEPLHNLNEKNLDKCFRIREKQSF